MSTVRLALAQVNPIVGDIDGNTNLIVSSIAHAKDEGADIVAIPELAITGYPPEDLLLKHDFIQANERALYKIATQTHGITAIVGFVESHENHLYNAAALIADGEVKVVYRKHHLPNYGVFDERRYFVEGAGIVLGKMGDLLFGITICEDLWSDAGPHAACAASGASLIININASPYHMGKSRDRHDLVARRALEHRVAFAYVNTVGGQDELVFDGASFISDASGIVVARAGQFTEELLIHDWEVTPRTGPSTSTHAATEGLMIVDLPKPNQSRREIQPRIASELDEEPEVYAALVLGVRDYLRKNGFEQALVGLSGGIDSALTACIAVDAIGPGNVLGVSNPSEYTSNRSLSGAEQLAKNLGIELLTIPIADTFDLVLKLLDPLLQGDEPGITEQNLQARIRGLLWMAISNKTGRMVLSTGNKSEMSVGYATLYGDMAGGLAVLKDVPKTLVYRLSRWRNLARAIIPPDIIDRPPSAELAPDQLDTDSLPPYDILDPILEAYVEDDISIDEISARGFDLHTVTRVAGMVDRAEYKRRQAPPGIKVTDRAFGRDRRLPITNRFRP
ncbi:MAG: NAD+ synthase [Actinomycetota bacterium]